MPSESIPDNGSTPARRVLYGYKRDGRWVIEPRFEKAEPFHHGLAAVRLDLTWGFCDTRGVLVIEPRFDGPHPPPPFLDGNFMGLSGTDRTGQVQFVERRQASEGLFAFNEGGRQAWDGKWGFRDADSGAVVIAAAFAAVRPFWGEYAAAMRWVEGTGGRWGLIDRAGTWVIQPDDAYLGCAGSDERGGLFMVRRGDTYLHGAVHPVRGEVEPFEERNLIADRSRLDPVWPPSKPRTPDDEALEICSAEVDHVPGAPRYPFRFYGMGISYGGEPDYRVQFAPGVEMQAAASALRDLQALEGAPDEYHLFVAVDGSFARLAFDASPEDAWGMEPDFIEHLVALHARFPIVEVVNLQPGTESVGSTWQTWSVEQQPTPDPGPAFGVPWVWS